ncbi:MAG: hypothetical protein ABI650_04715 [Dokdonella sp.]
MPPEGTPAAPIFFIDRSLGRRHVAEALRSAGAEVVIHDDVFSQNATDTEWLDEAGRRGWIVLTKDDAIRRHPQERHMVETGGVRMFALTARNLVGTEMADLFVRVLFGMQHRATTVKPPFIFAISRLGVFTRVL